jgi:hypothetical protein
VLVYGPLAHGVLGFRRNLTVIGALRRFAADRGTTVAQVAMAWLVAHPAVQVAIAGSRTPAQLRESAGALDLALSQADLAEIDTILAASVPLGGPLRKRDMTTIQTGEAARRSSRPQCAHWPRCPSALAHDRSGARTIASHPEQGWSLLCNGVVIFDDGGALLPDGRAVTPSPPLPPASARMAAAA